MLSDFLILELYYGQDAALRPLNELLDHYNCVHIEDAITQGDIQCYTAALGPDKGTVYYRLSQKGRIKAEAMLNPSPLITEKLQNSHKENPLYVLS